MHASILAVLALTGVCATAWSEPSPRENCLLGEFKTAPPELTVKELRERCANESETAQPGPGQEAPANPDASLLGARINREDAAEANRSTLVPHKRNYFMPITYMDEPNQRPFDEAAEIPPTHNLDNAEIKFQLSLKVSLLQSLFAENDQLYFGFTTIAFWQAYNSELSEPFREANYEPEFFYVTPVSWKVFNSDTTLLSFGFSHQSNGRGAPLSRSWNRLYANLIWERGNFVYSFKPWWRIPEDPKSDPLAAQGDDNPDIDEYMGNFEFTSLYRKDSHEFSLMLRNNLRSENRGAVQLEWTFPLYKRLRGYVEYFNGYGESLIDYDEHTQRIGVGFLLSDLL